MRAYIDELLDQGRVHVVDREVDGRFELAAVTQALQRRSDRPILFRRVAGAALPVITNVFGSRPRLCAMIGADDGLFCRRWTELMRAPVAPPGAAPPSPAVEEIALDDLPRITYFEKDAGPYITAGVFLAREPESGVPNLSFHRAMMAGENELRIRLGSSHDLTRYQAKAEARGEALEAAILLGPPKEIILAGAATLPYDDSELAVAERLRGAPLPMRRCRHIDLEVPAETEIVIEGRILPHVRRPEGPFGEFLGYYVPEGENHVFEVLGVTVRSDARFHALVCGSPEDLRLLELAIATRIYGALNATLPGILDVACAPSPMSTVIKMRPHYDGHAMQALITAIGAHHDYSKSCIAVDADIDINDFDDVYWAVLTRGRLDRKVRVIEDLPGFYRDPNKDFFGRLLIDATIPWGRETEFERKRIPGADTIDLSRYLGD